MEDGRLETLILDAIRARRPQATICPSEVARRLGGAGWRDHMPAVRRAADRLARAGLVSITQGGRPVDVQTVRGPIRLGRPSAFSEQSPGR